MAELADIKQRLSDLADNVLDGTVDKGKGAVVSQLLNVYLRALSVELKVREQEEILQRVVELEALMEQPETGEKAWRLGTGSDGSHDKRRMTAY